MPPLILLPPSEKKAPGGVGVPWHEAGQSFAGLDDARREVVAALDDAMDAPLEARAKLLGVGAANVDRATIANRRVDTAPTLPAIVRYTGVLYDALDAESLPARLRKRLDEQVVIFSGLWGAVRPSDPVPDYKLKMGATLPGLGRPSRYWKPHLTTALVEAGIATVWDLLPNEHTAAWDPSVARNRIRVRFLDDVERDGRRTLITVSHWNKLLKGALVRHLLEHHLDDPDGLAGFEHPEGYAYRPDLATTSGNTTDIALVAVR
ncbi:MAG: peroxide stress protein YaaA [Acidimicrobiales bacterium]|nr:peroxide stress protein YaaA [Acidimicrobiales bacterium]